MTARQVHWAESEEGWKDGGPRTSVEGLKVLGRLAV